VSDTPTPALKRGPRVPLIFAIVSYALASLYFFSDAIIDFGNSIYFKYGSSNELTATVGNFIVGLGLNAASIVWLIMFGLIGVALTVTVFLQRKKKTT
jgi:hypothetical protein